MNSHFPMNDQGLATPQGDPQSQFLDLVQSINSFRSSRHPFESYSEKARSAGELGENLFIDWLRIHKPTVDSSAYAFLAMPYITFRLMNGSLSKPVCLDKPTPRQVQKFLQALCEELTEVHADKEMFIAFANVQLKVLIKFLGVVLEPQVH